MGPDRGDHPGRIAQRPEMTGGPIPGRNFYLSDDSACARRADDERRLGLISISDMGHAVEQRSADATETALCITDDVTSAPGDRATGQGVGSASMQRHRGAAAASRSDHQIGAGEGRQQRWQRGGVMLIICIHRHHGIDPRVVRPHTGEPADERGALAAIGSMSHDVVCPTLPGPCGRVIARPIVDDDDQKLGRMRPHTLHHRSDGIRCLIGRDHARRALHQPTLPGGAVSSRRI